MLRVIGIILLCVAFGGITSIVVAYIIGGLFNSPSVPLPMLPWWPNLLINSVVYGFGWAIFVVIVALPLARRQRRLDRIARGLCVKCGYDLRKRPSDSSVCPECGATAM